MKCPGQDTRYWKPGDIFDVDCPHCGNKVEFFKDEATRQCAHCKSKVVNPRMNFGCAGYCQFAEQCLGDLGRELSAQRDDLFKDRLALEVKKLLGRDFKKIAHITNVARYAEEIACGEKAMPALVICASYLHVFYEGEQGATTGQQTAADILKRLNAGPELTGKVLDVIDRFFAEDAGDSLDVKVFFDAHLLALHEERADTSHETLSKAADIHKQYLTDTGKRLSPLFH